MTDANQRIASRLSTAGATLGTAAALLTQSGIQGEILGSVAEPEYGPPIAAPALVGALKDVIPQPLQQVPTTGVLQFRADEPSPQPAQTILASNLTWSHDGAGITEERFDPNLVLMGRWAGTVLILDGEVFTARIRDLNGVAPDEEGEFLVDQFSFEDRELVRPGATFYWYITRQNVRFGRRQEIGEFKLQRLGQLEAPKTSEWAERIASAAEQQQRKSPTSTSFEASQLATSIPVGLVQRLVQWIGRGLNQTK